MPACPYQQAWLDAQFPSLIGATPLVSGGQKWALSATHHVHGPVALKIYHPGADVERAKREIDAIKLIASPRVPTIHENGVVQHNGGVCLWVVEQWVNGKTLRDTLAAGPLADKAIIRLGQQLLEVIALAEAKRIVHRDIKPENILMDANGTDAWLLDFGIARHLDLKSLTVTGATGPCTAGYAPAEQFMNWKKEIDTRADLFSIGVTLFEASEGVNPLRHGTSDLAEVYRRTMQGLPAMKRAVEPTGEFRDLVFMMTRPRATHRFRTAAEALDWMRDIAKP